MLSDGAIRAAKPHETKVLKLSDAGGLQLWVPPTGSKLWRLAYRFAGKQKKLALGGWPAVSLKDARAKREEAKALLAAGVDPGQQKKSDKTNAAILQANTFGRVADQLLAKNKREGKSEATLSKKAGVNIPDFLWIEWAFLADETSLVPRRLPMALLLD